MDALEKIINALKVVNLPIKPLFTDSAKDCIVYKLSTISDNGLVEVDKLELRIITNTLEKAMEIERQVKQVLVTIGDIPKNGINSIVVNGGGVLKDQATNTVHLLLYFNITKKSEVVL